MAETGLYEDGKKGIGARATHLRIKEMDPGASVGRNGEIPPRRQLNDRGRQTRCCASQHVARRVLSLP
jgi:hypothetical protein